MNYYICGQCAVPVSIIPLPNKFRCEDLCCNDNNRIGVNGPRLVKNSSLCRRFSGSRDRGLWVCLIRRRVYDSRLTVVYRLEGSHNMSRVHKWFQGTILPFDKGIPRQIIRIIGPSMFRVLDLGNVNNSENIDVVGILNHDNNWGIILLVLPIR